MNLRYNQRRDPIDFAKTFTLIAPKKKGFLVPPRFYGFIVRYSVLHPTTGEGGIIFFSKDARYSYPLSIYTHTHSDMGISLWNGHNLTFNLKFIRSRYMYVCMYMEDACCRCKRVTNYPSSEFVQLFRGT